MSAARAEIFEQLRAAVGGVAAPPPPPAPRTARRGEAAELSARLGEYRAKVTVLKRAEAVRSAVAAILARQAAKRVAVPVGLPSEWRPAGVDLHEDRPQLSHGELADLDAALTGSRLAIARTGTIVLDTGPEQGRRALSLLPDLHVCVIRAETIVLDVEDAFAALAGSTAPITFVSGPSATSDIELDRVEGVHGPRRLEVVVIRGDPHSQREEPR